MQIEERHLKIIKAILKKYDYDFYLFGSRAKGEATKFSDLDLFFTAKIPSSQLGNLREDMENSNLPYNVDIIDYNSCSPDFQKVLKGHNIRIQ